MSFLMLPCGISMHFARTIIVSPAIYSFVRLCFKYKFCTKTINTYPCHNYSSTFTPKGVPSANFILNKSVAVTNPITPLFLSPITSPSLSIDMIKLLTSPFWDISHPNGWCFSISCQHSFASLNGRYLASGLIRYSVLFQNEISFISVQSFGTSVPFMVLGFGSTLNHPSFSISLQNRIKFFSLISVHN